MIRIHHILCLSQTERLGERTTRWTIMRKHTSTRRWSDHDHVWTGLKLIQLTGTQRTIKGNKDFSWPHSDHFQRASVITTTLELDINKIHRLIKIVVCCLSLEKFGWIFISCLNINCIRDLISHAQPGQLGRSSRSSTNERVSAPIGSSGCMSRSPWARSWIPNCSWWLFHVCLHGNITGHCIESTVSLRMSTLSLWHQCAWMCISIGERVMRCKAPSEVCGLEKC